MPQALAHFAVGMAMTTLLITIGWRSVRYPRILVFGGGVWAMLPDIHWILPQTRDWKHLYHDHAIANGFWFHQFLDTRVDPMDTDPFVALTVVFLAVVTVWAERRTYRSPERLQDEQDSSE